MTSSNTPPNELQKLVELMQDLGSTNQGPFGWIYSSTRNCVDYKDRGATKRVQAELDALVPGLLIVYLFSLFESYLPQGRWEEVLDNPTFERLMAYQHIRHSFAHSPDGKRAKKSKKPLQAFDDVAASQNPLQGVTHTDSHLSLDSSVSFDVQSLMDKAAKMAIVHVAGNGPTASA